MEVKILFFFLKSFSIILFSIILPIITFYIGKRLGKKSIISDFDSKINEGIGKLGLIKLRDYDDGKYFNHFIEIEEIYTANYLTKYKIIKINKSRESKKTDKEILKELSTDFIKTDEIIWLDDNSQRIRNNKLKELLGEN